MIVDAYMSQDAQNLLSELAKSEPSPTTLETLEARRAEAKAAFLPRADRAVARYGVSVEQVTIAGHPCLEIQPSTKVRGTVLYCFGGGYISGSAREDLIVSAALSAGAHARVVAVDYPLAPEYPWPAAHDAAWAVFQSLQRDDPCLAIAGESAGGNLALTVMQRASMPPSAVLLLSPWCDLTHRGDSLLANNGRDPTLGLDLLQFAAALYAGTAEVSQPAISPINGSFFAEGPPVMITTGTRDLLLSQCIELARCMRIAGQDVRLDVYDGLWHVFEFYDELPEAQISLEACSSFLKKHLAG